MPIWVVASQGAKKGAGTAVKGVGKAGKAAKNGVQKGLGKAANTGRKSAQKAGKAGKNRINPGNKANNRKPFGKEPGKGGSSGSGNSGGKGKSGSGGSGGSGPGPLGKGKKKNGGRWGQRAKNLAGGAVGGGRGGGSPGAGGGAEGGDAATAGTDAARRLVARGWRRRRGPFKKTRTRLGRVLTVILLLLVGYPLMSGTIGSNAAAEQTEAVMSMQCSGAPPPLMHEQTGIPIDALKAYCSAAVEWNVDWAILAAIGNFECSHWQNRTDPGCDPGPPHTVNSKGARGPMQFLGSTWRGSAGAMDIDVAGPPIPEGEENQGFATDGDDDAVADPWSWRDATHAAARKLVHDGVEEDPHQALMRYNPSEEYANDVLTLAAQYRSKIDRIMDEEAPGGGGATAIGPCPWQAEGDTGPVPASNNTEATQTMANTLIECFGRNGRAVGCWAERGGDLYEHPRGRACDFMMSSGVASGHDRERGLAMAEWAQAHADELNILYVIWYNKIWFRGKDPAGAQSWDTWRSYGCGGCGATKGHFDHVHVSVKLMPGDPPRASCPHVNCTE